MLVVIIVSVSSFIWVISVLFSATEDFVSEVGPFINLESTLSSALTSADVLSIVVFFPAKFSA